jgi:hypothetical protein
MRLLSAAIIVLIVAGSAGAARAQGYCPFPAFCGAQQSHCHGSCEAFMDVITWPRRPYVLEKCAVGCDVQYGRCMRRVIPRCGFSVHARG